MKVIHIIPSLNIGGAEMMLYKVVKEEKENSIVVSLRDLGPIGKMLMECGVKVIPLNFSSYWNLPKGVYKLIRQIRKFKPDIIQGWMYHGNIMALIIKFFVWKAKLIWNIRCTLVDKRYEKKTTIFIAYLNKIFSNFPKKIIFNSKVSMDQHKKYGFPLNSQALIGNGFDTNLFKPNNDKKLKFKESLGLNPSDFLIGHVARYHPMKDHVGFLKIAGMTVSQGHKNFFFCMVGNGVDNSLIRAQIKELNLEENLNIIESNTEVHQLMPCFDFLIITSKSGEAFPNVLGEAMSCEVCCISTNIGDSKYILNQDENIFEPEDYTKISQKIIDMSLNKTYIDYGKKNRQRILQNYSLEKIVDEYHQLYSAVLKR